MRLITLILKLGIAFGGLSTYGFANDIVIIPGSQRDHGVACIDQAGFASAQPSLWFDAEWPYYDGSGSYGHYLWIADISAYAKHLMSLQYLDRDGNVHEKRYYSEYMSYTIRASADWKNSGVWLGIADADRDGKMRRFTAAAEADTASKNLAISRVEPLRTKVLNQYQNCTQ